MWGRLGEIANQYLTKGARIYVEGKLEHRSYESNDGSGEKKYITEIRVNEMKMLGGGRDAGNRDAGQGGGFPTHGGDQDESRPEDNAKGGKNDPFASAPDFGDVPVDDDIPF